MKVLTQIKNWFSGSVIFEAEVEGDSQNVRLGLAVKMAFGARADLTGAALTGAVLMGADLTGAALTGADLTGAVLRRADLTGAVLTYAVLRRADLTDAVLRRADLRRADLTGAVLRRADLTGAVLMGDTKLIGGRPVLQIGPIGSRSDYLMAFITNKGLYLQTGCFLGDLAQFRAALAKTHNSDLHATEYSAALQLVFSHVELWTPKKDASAETAPLDVHKASA